MIAAEPGCGLLGPAGHPQMEFGSSLLEEPTVSRISDEEVMEAEERNRQYRERRAVGVPYDHDFPVRPNYQPPTVAVDAEVDNRWEE